jgi:tRNA (cytidine/uridine-2'-O-)-methyltransferase
MHSFKVVLIEPEIPQNTGNIGRLCLATQSELHLIEPMGFEITDSRLKRAGLDYWEHLKVKIHPGIDAFFEQLPPCAPLVFFEVDGGKSLYEHQFDPGSYLFFGKETSSIPHWIMNKYPDRVLRIPMFDARIRSLNLANSVSIALYEAIRQNQHFSIN